MYECACAFVLGLLSHCVPVHAACSCTYMCAYMCLLVFLCHLLCLLSVVCSCSCVCSCACCLFSGADRIGFSREPYSDELVRIPGFHLPLHSTMCLLVLIAGVLAHSGWLLLPRRRCTCGSGRADTQTNWYKDAGGPQTTSGQRTNIYTLYFQQVSTCKLLT